MRIPFAVVLFCREMATGGYTNAADIEDVANQIQEALPHGCLRAQSLQDSSPRTVCAL